MLIFDRSVCACHDLGLGAQGQMPARNMGSQPLALTKRPKTTDNAYNILAGAKPLCFGLLSKMWNVWGQKWSKKRPRVFLLESSQGTSLYSMQRATCSISLSKGTGQWRPRPAKLVQAGVQEGSIRRKSSRLSMGNSHHP